MNKYKGSGGKKSETPPKCRKWCTITLRALDGWIFTDLLVQMDRIVVGKGMKRSVDDHKGGIES